MHTWLTISFIVGGLCSGLLVAEPHIPRHGVSENRLSKNLPLHYKPGMDSSSNHPREHSPAVLQGTSSLIEVAHAQRHDLTGLPRVLPTPKQAEFTNQLCRLPNPIRMMASADSLDDLACRELSHALAEEFAISMTDTADSPTISFVRSDQEHPAEWYALEVRDAGIQLRARDQAGFLHAVQTLKQLFVRDEAGHPAIHTCRIEDWPSLSFRGVHLFTGGQGPDLHLDLIRQLLAPLKLNHIVLECEYIEWESAPEIHHPQNGMPKSQVKEMISTARNLGIAISPLVMSLGHCQWIFESGHYLELAEDPEAKWAYCVTNPDTYEFIHNIYQEAIDLFEPKYFHIGHDEYTQHGRVPYRESSKPHTPEQLFMLDTLRHHAWLKDQALAKGRPVRMLMWGDMLLGPGEAPDACHADSVEMAKSLRDVLPKDVIITDWHYEVAKPEQYTNLSTFHHAGFETIAATWFEPGNVVNHARAAYQQKSLGLLQTTWAGFSLDPQSFARELHQYIVYPLAAEAAWNADREIDADEVLYGEHFMRLMGLSTLSPGNRQGWLAPLLTIYNEQAALHCCIDSNGAGAKLEQPDLPHGRVHLEGIGFQLVDDQEPGKANVCVLANSKSRDHHLPDHVELTFSSHSADQLVFLHAASASSEKLQKIASYEVIFEDNARIQIDLEYGQNLFALDDLSAAANAPIVWHGKTGSGKSIALRVLIWNNPKPGTPIHAIHASSAQANASLLWFGLTGLHSPN